MPARGLLIATAVLALLAGGVWYSNRQEAKKDPTERTAESPRILSIPLAKLARLHVEGPAAGPDPYTIERSSDGMYKITSPKAMMADTETGTALFVQFSALDADRVVDPKPASLAAFGLEPPKLIITAMPTPGAGSEVKLLLGDDSPTGMATFAKLGNETRVVTLPKNITASLFKTLRDVMDHRLIPYERSKLQSVTITNGASKISLVAGTSGWLLGAGGPRADGGTVEPLLIALDQARMNPMDTQETMDASAKIWATAKPAGSVSIVDAAGTHSIEVRKAGPDAYIKSSAIEGIHKTGAMLIDLLAKPAADYRNKTVFDFGFDDPSSVTIKGTGLSRVLTQTDGKWSEGGKPLDSISAQSLVDKLRELKATGFGKAAGAIDLDIAMVSNKGARNEQVSIAKAGSTYAAMRKGDVDAYLLDSKAVDELLQAARDVKPSAPDEAKKVKK